MACNKTQYVASSQHSACIDNCYAVQFCENKSIFQYAAENYINNDQFCDGYKLSNDGTDEIKNQTSFKYNECITSPTNFQRNHDSDICFLWLDTRLNIFPKQMCDDVINCLDSSDKFFCVKNKTTGENFFAKKNNSCFKNKSLNFF